MWAKGTVAEPAVAPAPAFSSALALEIGGAGVPDCRLSTVDLAPPIVPARLGAIAAIRHRAPAAPPGGGRVEEHPGAAGVAALPHPGALVRGEQVDRAEHDRVERGCQRLLGDA